MVTELQATAAADLYAAYWAAASDLLGCDPRHRSSAIALNGAPVHGWNADDATRKLFRCFDGPFWKRPASESVSNWMWRAKVPIAADGNIEVGVERRVAELGGPDEWTCQMPTLSGFFGSAAHKRRSIDLVQRIGPAFYRLIELKVGSDTPLYALFELLGYGLTYLHARRHGHHGSGKHDVMDAKRLELLILAPDDWYRFRRRGAAQAHTFDLSWLSDSIGQAISALASPLQVQIRFERFEWIGDVSKAGADICRRLATTKVDGQN